MIAAFDLSIQFFLYLVIAFLGIVAPLISGFLSLHYHGISILTKRYSEEDKNQEDDLNKALQSQKQQDKSNKIDVDALEVTLKKIKKNRSRAKGKLNFLNPKRQIKSVFILLFLSFLGGVFCFFLTDIKYCWLKVGLFFLSFVCFLIVVWNLWKLVLLVIEIQNDIQKAQDDVQKNFESKISGITDLITQLVVSAEKNAVKLLSDVKISIDDHEVKDSLEVTLVANKEQVLSVAIINSERRMAKELEAGFCFPGQFLIVKKPDYSVYSGNTQKIVRYSVKSLHSTTNQKITSLTLTPLEEGSYSIQAFLKGENIEEKKVSFKIKVVKASVGASSIKSEGSGS